MQNSMLMLILLMLTSINIALSQILYPEHIEMDKKKSNIDGRLPTFAPSRCGKNELLYPGDQADDWICDCAPASLYYPDSDGCFLAFRQGPCESEQILVLGRNKTIPECIANACKTDGKIQINNVCYTFGDAEPCKKAHWSFVLGVDATSLQVDCVKLSLALKTRFDEDTETTSDEEEPTYDLATINKCSRGTKRAINGRCP